MKNGQAKDVKAAEDYLVEHLDVEEEITVYPVCEPGDVYMDEQWVVGLGITPQVGLYMIGEEDI